MGILAEARQGLGVAEVLSRWKAWLAENNATVMAALLLVLGVVRSAGLGTPSNHPAQAIEARTPEGPDRMVEALARLKCGACSGGEK